MRSYRLHTDSETKTVTIKLCYESTMAMLPGSDANALQGVDHRFPNPLCVVATIYQKKGMTLRTQITRLARRWSPCDGRGERRTEGHLQPWADPYRLSDAAESWCRMATGTAHGAGETPVGAHVGRSAARSHELIQLSKDSPRQRRSRS